jgi:hypothetical protein
MNFGRLYAFTQNLAFFVTRAKRNLDYSRRSYRQIDGAPLAAGGVNAIRAWLTNSHLVITIESEGHMGP